MIQLHTPLLKSISLCLALGIGISCSRSEGEKSAPKLVVNIDTVSVSKGLDAWNRHVMEKFETSGLNPNKEGYMECAAVSELKGAYLCAASSPYRMNQAFARASIFVEGLYRTSKKTVVSNKSDAFEKSLRQLAGHDLKSEDLAEFWKAAEAACSESTDKLLCPGPNERSFFETFVLPKLATNEPFVVISYSAAEDAWNWREVVTHEIMHAQYFLETEFRNTVDTFWQDKVSAEDKEAIKKILSKTYDVNDELLVKNEFQAYILQQGGEGANLGGYTPSYRQPLLDALKAQGVVPVFVNTAITN